MSAFRSSQPDFGYGRATGTRWDSERFEFERDRARTGRFEEPRISSRELAVRPRPRERSVDGIYERRGPRGYEEFDYHRDERYYDEEPRYAREPSRPRQAVKIEIDREREVIREQSPPRRGGRPVFLRRQSSLDTFDRKPFPRYEREEYGPPARLRDVRPPEFVREPLPPRRALPPPRRYEREIEIAEPDYYGDDNYRPYPERVVEREIIRTRRRSRERSRSRRGSVRSSSSSSRESEVVIKNEFPKRGKTRMPARLVHKRAIIELGYPFEEEGDVIIIQKALGRENIDEVIKLSEVYKVEKIEMSGGRSEAGEAPPPPPAEGITMMPPPPPSHHPHEEEFVKTTTIERREVSPARSHRSVSVGPPRMVHEERRIYEERGPPEHMQLVTQPFGRKGEREIRAEIKALEAEKEALKAERRADRELRKADRIRNEGRESGELILYEEDTKIVRRNSRRESEGVRIEKDKKGPNPRALGLMLKTLT